jgi:sulfur relay (sulfurtransferase) complex TusBCD TusD component (DsrE family)
MIEDVEDTPAIGADYLRVVAQNEPHYLYCAACQEQGEQTVAIYVCYHCSDRRGAMVAFCDECIDEHDEDHYYEESVY